MEKTVKIVREAAALAAIGGLAGCVIMLFADALSGLAANPTKTIVIMTLCALMAITTRSRHAAAYTFIAAVWLVVFAAAIAFAPRFQAFQALKMAIFVLILAASIVALTTGLRIARRVRKDAANSFMRSCFWSRGNQNSSDNFWRPHY